MTAATGLVLASRTSEDASAGYIALLILVLLFLATGLLIRNMSGRLKRMPKEFEPPAGSGDEPPPRSQDR